MKGKQTIKILNCCPQTRRSLTYLRHQIASSSSPSFPLLFAVATELVNHPGYLILKTQSYQLLLQLFHPFRKIKEREKERKGEREREKERKGGREKVRMLHVFSLSYQLSSCFFPFFLPISSDAFGFDETRYESNLTVPKYGE